MRREDFKERTRYVVTLKDPETGRLRPANIYVYRLHDGFMIARRTDQDALLLKIPYEQVIRIVQEVPADPVHTYAVPEALLSADSWRDRDRMALYASSPALGK